eukprot:EG_transcript_34486
MAALDEAGNSQGSAASSAASSCSSSDAPSTPRRRAAAAAARKRGAPAAALPQGWSPQDVEDFNEARRAVDPRAANYWQLVAAQVGKARAECIAFAEGAFETPEKRRRKAPAAPLFSAKGTLVVRSGWSRSKAFDALTSQERTQHQDDAFKRTTVFGVP